ncbi:MAG: SwmB domain-containing protein [Cyanobacteriota bacterium]
MQAASGGKNPELTLINGVAGPLLNVAASISYQTTKQGKNGKPNKDFQGGIGSGNYFSASLGFSTLYNYSNTPNSQGYFPLANEKGSLGLSFGVKFPIYEEPPFFVNFLGSVGVAFQWQLSPSSPDYVPLLSPYLAPNSSGSDAFLAASINIPPLGAVEAIALALLSDITEIIGRADDNLVLDGLDVSIPVSAGLAGGINIPYLFQAILSAQVYLNGKFSFAEQTPATGAFTLGVPIRLTVKALGFLGGTLEYFPEWKWSWDLSTTGEISGALLNDGFSAASDASVQGSLITFNLDDPLTTSLNVDPNDFEVTVTNADGSTVTIPVFGVVAPAGSEVVSFRLEQTIPYQSSVGFEQSPTIELIYNGSEPLSWFDGDSVPVINASSPNFVYTYNPTGGTDDDYTGTSNQLVINFNTQLNPQIIPDVSQFTLENSDVTVTSVLGVTNQSVTLELSAPISGAFTVSYQVNDQGLQLQDSNNNPLPSFTFESGAVSNTGFVNSLFNNSIATTNVIAGIANDFVQDQTPALALTASNNILMAWSSDAPPLAPISAVVNPDNSSQIYINFFVPNSDEILGGSPQPEQFQVFVEGNPNAVENIGDPAVGTVTLNLTSPINVGETVTVSYGLNSDPNESADNLFLTDVTGTTLWIPAFENVAVTNNSDGAGQPLAAVATLTTYQDSIATALTLTFAQNIDSSSLDLSQFLVYANNEVILLEPNYASSQNLLSLILAEPVRQGDLISVYYSPNTNDEGVLKDSNGLTLNGFEVQQVVTAPAVASTVIKTTTNASNAKLESIPGTGNGLDFDPAAIEYNGQNIVAWARVDSSDLNNQAIPGQIYGEEDTAQINQALGASDIYYSIYNPTLSSWSVAAPIALDQAGQDQKVALGLGPDNEVIAAWLNTTNDNNETTTSIYWSSFNNAGWTTPKPVLAEITPDAFTELSVEMLGGEAAVFWTESQPSSYSSLVLADNPLIYLRLAELTGTVANNLGTLGTPANGAYTGTVSLNEKGALENPETSTGDPNPAAQFDGGGSLTLDTAIPLTSQGWAVEFWFKVADLPTAALNLLSLQLNFLTLEPPNSGSNPVFELSLNGSTLSLDFEGGSLQAPNVAADTWQYVVGSYDGADNTLSLYLNGSLVETSTLTLTEPLPNTAQLTLAGGDSALFLDEVAVYGSPLANATTPFQPLTSDNFTTIPGDQILNQSFGVNPIGSRYTAQYNDPVPAGPEVHYSVLNGSTWQAPEPINPITAIVPTILSDANPALWDIVSNTEVANGSRISPNGIADTLFQSTLVSQVGQTLMGIALVVDGQTYSLGNYFNKGSQTLLTGNQLAVIIGDRLVNSLNPTEAATDLSYPIRSESLDLVLAIDTGTAPNSSNLPTVNSYTLYFADGNSVSYSTTQNPSDLPVFIPPSSEPATADNTQVLGVATVTEANDSSLKQIDSGFIINTDNSAIATVLAKGFNRLNSGQLAYIAVGNRGYTNTSGTVVTPPGGGTVQILLAGEDALNNNTTIPLSTTNLLGNPNGILITGLTDNGSANNHVAMSLATGDVDGDGIDDLVIGDANVNNGAGAIYVFYGSYLTSLQNQTLDVSQLSTTSNSMGFVVNGLDEQGGAGFAVAVGQFFTTEGTPAQIAFGAPFAQSEGVSAGNVYLVSVSSATATPTTSLLYTGQTFNITNSNNQAETVGEAAGYSLGVSALKTGAPTPFSGSTLGDDLLIGAPGYRQNITNQWTNLNQLPSGNQGDYPAQSWVATGAVHVFSAQSNNGVIRSTQLATYTGANIPDTNGVAANYFAGGAIASEDFNGDGRQDLAISAEGVNGNSGAVYVLNGQDAPVASSSLPLTIPLIPLNTASNLTINGGIPTARVGTVITAAGDINDDKHQDFLITTPQALNGTGQSYLLFGPLNLDQVGASLDLDVTSGDSGQVFLLSGDFPYQLAGTAAIGAGDINGDGVDDLLLSAPNAQQLYAVYGHPWLADDGSIKLPNLSADNGFVIDGNLVSSPLVTLFSDSLNNSPSKTSPALITNNGALYLAYTDSNGQIYFTSSANNGQTWSQAVPLPSDAQAAFAPSLAFYNDVLYLAYVDADDDLYVTYSADNGETWNSPYQLGGSSSTAPTLIAYQNSLFFFFTADNPTSSILYYYADNPNSNAQNPLTSVDWIYSNQIVGGNYATSSDMSAAVVDNTLYLALNGGTVNNSSGDIYLVLGSGDDPANLTWSDYAVPNLGATQVAPGLTSDGENLYLTYTDESTGNVNLIISTDDGTSQTLDGLPSQILPVLATTDNQLYFAYVGASQGVYVAESPLPFVDSIVGNGSIVQLLGDVNGDGFADIFSGGTNTGVVVFGKSTDALLDAALLTDDLIITLANANLQDVISLGDFNGDGFKDFGVLDSNQNFSVVLGSPFLEQLGQLTVTPTSTPVVISQVGGVTQAEAIADYNGDGYDDVLLWGDNGNQVGWGNSDGALNSFTNIDYPETQTSATGVDLNGNGITEIAIGSDISPMAGTISTTGSFSLLPTPTTSSVINTLAAANQLQTIGDFNGDGIEDLAVLASNYYAATLGEPLNLNQAGNQGAVFIYYGSLQGLTSR